MNAKIEEVAQAIYHIDDGLTDEDYLAIHGKARRKWGTPDRDGTDVDQLCEWERDGYRAMAEAAIEALQS